MENSIIFAVYNSLPKKLQDFLNRKFDMVEIGIVPILAVSGLWWPNLFLYVTVFVSSVLTIILATLAVRRYFDENYQKGEKQEYLPKILFYVGYLIGFQLLIGINEYLKYADKNEYSLDLILFITGVGMSVFGGWGLIRNSMSKKQPIK